MKGIGMNYHNRPISLFVQFNGSNEKLEIISAWYSDTGEYLPDEDRTAIAVFRHREIEQKFWGDTESGTTDG